MTTLKPCPICGAEINICEGETWSKSHFAECCGDCGCSWPIGSDRKGTPPATDSVAASNWNRMAEHLEAILAARRGMVRKGGGE